MKHCYRDNSIKDTLSSRLKTSTSSVKIKNDKLPEECCNNKWSWSKIRSFGRTNSTTKK